LKPSSRIGLLTEQRVRTALSRLSKSAAVDSARLAQGPHG
jgi:hypothetical protein